LLLVGELAFEFLDAFFELGLLRRGRCCLLRWVLRSIRARRDGRRAQGGDEQGRGLHGDSFSFMGACVSAVGVQDRRGGLQRQQLVCYPDGYLFGRLKIAFIRALLI
jgi:hypothetical protein